MLIPSKFNGYSFDGSRRCFGGGGGGGGGDGAGDSSGGSAPGGDAGGGGDPNNVYIPPTNMTNTNVNTNRGSVTGMNFTGGNTAGTSTIPSNNLNLQNMYGVRYDQSGPQYNALLQQGYTGNDIRNALTTNGRPVSDSDYGYLVQNAGMTSPTNRPYAGSDQFFQPVYNSSYMNYARPATQFDVSMYGTQPVQSPASASGMSRGNINSTIGNYFQQNPNSDINSTLPAMRSSGINRSDIQQFGGVNNYGPQMSMPSMQAQAQQPFNPFSNTSGYGGGLPMTAGYGGFGSRVGGLSPYVTGQMSQMQSPFSFQQPSYQPSYQQQSYQPQMQTPFSYQQQSYQPSYQSSYGDTPETFGYGAGYSSYGGNFGGGVNMYTPVTQQPTQPVAPRSSGPTSPIVGRSAGFRGTPNVMRRAEGGIASLMDDVE
jgi:hypothetical protein